MLLPNLNLMESAVIDSALWTEQLKIMCQFNGNKTLTDWKWDLTKTLYWWESMGTKTSSPVHHAVSADCSASTPSCSWGAAIETDSFARACVQYVPVCVENHAVVKPVVCFLPLLVSHSEDTHINWEVIFYHQINMVIIHAERLLLISDLQCNLNFMRSCSHCSLSQDWSHKYHRCLWPSCPPSYWLTKCDWIGFTMSASYLTIQQWNIMTLFNLTIWASS